MSTAFKSCELVPLFRSRGLDETDWDWPTLLQALWSEDPGLRKPVPTAPRRNHRKGSSDGAWVRCRENDGLREDAASRISGFSRKHEGICGI